ncbi:MAG: helix-turn-helix transcriptional regulator [Gammaproteobacteria bacterium]|nr:helix-turn-helix transcriptional regulator [Gammaproteobacteria bacterium]
MSETIRTTGQLGKILSGHRKSLGITQKEAAKTVGMLPKTISGLELHTGKKSIDSLLKLLSALELELAIRPKGSDSKDSSLEW